MAAPPLRDLYALLSARQVSSVLWKGRRSPDVAVLVHVWFVSGEAGVNVWGLLHWLL